MDKKGDVIDSESMREAMRNWATGVTVVASQFNGEMHGMTVSSFTSVSLDPAMVLVSLQLEARTHDLITASGIFSVTILDSFQKDISDRFAGRIPDNSNRFEGLETFSLVTGAPMLAGGLAHFDCRVSDKYTIGGHTLFFGEVLAAQVRKASTPLVYYNREYWGIEPNENN